MQSANNERLEYEGVNRRCSVLVAQVSWCAHVWNSTPQQAARQIVADLFAHLSRGGSVSVSVEGLDGMQHELQVAAQRQ